MRHAPVIVVGVLAAPALILWAQRQHDRRPQPPHTAALEIRVQALEARVAILERHARHPGKAPTVTGELDGLPRQVLDAVAWAHPGAVITDSDRDEDFEGRVTWEIELTAQGVDWVMTLTPDGRVIDDRVDD